jgi:hypothetical protein
MTQSEINRGLYLSHPHSKKTILTAPLGESSHCDQVAGADILGPPRLRRGGCEAGGGAPLE